MTQPSTEPTTTDPAQQDPAGATPPEPKQAPADDKPLGPGGEKALREEREARKALEKQVADLAPLAQLIKSLGGGDVDKGKTELQQLQERQSAMEATLAAERTARWRAEIAAEKGLTVAQAARLAGDSREAIAADADALLTLFPAPQPTGPRAPAPDRTQGGSGAGEISEIDAQIAAAEKAGDAKRLIALRTRKFAESMK